MHLPSPDADEFEWAHFAQSGVLTSAQAIGPSAGGRSAGT